MHLHPKIKLTLVKNILSIALLTAGLNTARAQPTIMGLTAQGGTDNAGAIIAVTTGFSEMGNVFSFQIEGGMNPQGDLTIASNGKLYGLTKLGGAHNFGVLFEYDPNTNSVLDKTSFSLTDGTHPTGSLVQASNGKLYGLTSQGADFSGSLFEYIPSNNTLNRKFAFSDPNLGASPTGSLMEASNGKLYGLTVLGGTNGDGILFEYDPASNVFTKKIDFEAPTKGASPFGSLMQASNGKLYGMTSSGGSSLQGTLFEYDPVSNVFTVKTEFGNAIGIIPMGKLIEGENGKLYGLTTAAGSNGGGVLFEFDPATDAISPKIHFNNGNNDGLRPYGSLIRASNGKMYGMTSEGGVHGGGTLFEYDYINDIYARVIDFDPAVHGSKPVGSLIQTPDGGLAGLTSKGGPNNVGVMFAYDLPSGTYLLRHAFVGAVNGRSPTGSLVIGPGGLLYGITGAGGQHDNGVLFSYDPASSVFEKKADFVEALTGVPDDGGITLASNGNLYGLAKSGGASMLGVLFEYNISTNQLAPKFAFDGATYGQSPLSQMLALPNGKLFGMTWLGGIYNSGTLFEYDPITNVFSKKIDFAGSSDGSAPNGSLIKGVGSKLYGMTSSGGANNAGILFQYDLISQTYSKKIDFESFTKGAFPWQSLVAGPGGKLFGVTQLGGLNNLGVLFEYDTANNTLTRRYEFPNMELGVSPASSLLLGRNGKLYGMTTYGGASNRGTLYEFDPTNSTFVKKIDMGGANGEPSYENLVEACLVPRLVTVPPGRIVDCAGNVTPVGVTVESVAHATSYEWTLPAGASILTGANTSSITVDLSDLAVGSYEIGVAGVNVCGTGPSTLMQLMMVASPPDPAVTVTAPTCEVLVGSIAIIVQNDSDVYSFDNGTTFQAEPVKIDLASGDYHVAVANIAGCVTTKLVTVPPSPKPSKPVITESHQDFASPVLSTVTADAYQWYFNGDLIPGATSKTLTVEEVGAYMVRVTSDDCESDLSDPMVIVVTGVIDRNERIESRVYPNPTSSELTVELNDFDLNEDVNIVVHDLLGRNIYRTIEKGSHAVAINVSQYRDGTYILILRQGSNVRPIRFLKVSD